VPAISANQKFFLLARRSFLDKRIQMNSHIFLFLGGVGAQEILLIGLVVLILFGAKKIPEFMRGLGKGVKEFKDGVNDMKADVEKDLDDKK
jgi:sec-independent protein translocase protein TatA